MEGQGAGKSVWDVPGLEAYHGQEIYLTEALAIEAARAIQDAVKQNEPFFINFAPYAVHVPIMANEKLLPHYPDIDPNEAAYATMIETMDAALGSILDQLESLGVADQTAVIFSSDNGGLSAHARGRAPDGKTAHTHNAPLRSGKGSCYEGGTRVPTIIAWPGITRETRSCHIPIITHDLFPTILSMAGVEIPEDYAPLVEGRDLTPLLKEEPGFEEKRALYWHQPHQWGASGPGIAPFTSILHEGWKLIYFHADCSFELYNLAKDVGETRNLVNEEAERVRRLAALLDQWIRK
ncbi:MAG: sulfatase-like hydrolase/transferase, partial [Planctomycetota bacterium]